MDIGLRVLLPIYNAHHALEATVSEILDVLPDGGRFELCLVDDGSNDETAELACELATRYPQVSVVHHPARLGLAEATWKALVHMRAELVIVANEVYAMEPDDLRVLWQLRDNDTQRAGGELWANRWPRLRARDSRRFQLIHRWAFEQFRASVEKSRRVDAASSLANIGPARPNFLRDTQRAQRE